MAITTDTVRRRRPNGANAASVALMALSAVTGASFARVFIGWGWLPLLLILGAASHALAIGFRRCRWGFLRSAVASVIGLVGAASLALSRHVSAFGLPTRDVLRHAAEDLSQAWQHFTSVKALTPADDGFLLAACLAVWVAAWAADGLAFRARLGVEPIVPTGIAFGFVAAVAADRHRVTFTVAWLATALLVLLLLKIESLGMSGGWVTTPLAASRSPRTFRATYKRSSRRSSPGSPTRTTRRSHCSSGSERTSPTT